MARTGRRRAHQWSSRGWKLAEHRNNVRTVGQQFRPLACGLSQRSHRADLAQVGHQPLDAPSAPRLALRSGTQTTKSQLAFAGMALGENPASSQNLGNYVRQWIEGRPHQESGATSRSGETCKEAREACLGVDGAEALERAPRHQVHQPATGYTTSYSDKDREANGRTRDQRKYTGHKVGAKDQAARRAYCSRVMKSSWQRVCVSTVAECSSAEASDLHGYIQQQQESSLRPSWLVTNVSVGDDNRRGRTHEGKWYRDTRMRREGAHAAQRQSAAPVACLLEQALFSKELARRESHHSQGLQRAAVQLRVNGRGRCRGRRAGAVRLHTGRSTRSIPRHGVARFARPKAETTGSKCNQHTQYKKHNVERKRRSHTVAERESANLPRMHRSQAPR